MQGQMTIFDFLPQESDFCDMPEDAVMDIISQRIGIRLTWDNHFEHYSARIGKVMINAKIEEYSCTHEGSQTVIAGHKYIGAGWAMSTAGGGRPCDSIDDAVDYLKGAMKRGKR